MRLRWSWRAVDWPLRRPLTTGAAPRVRECLELRLELGSGRGRGEAAPLPGLHRETRDLVAAAAARLPDLLPDADPAAPLEALSILEGMLGGAPPSLRWAAGWALVQALGWPGPGPGAPASAGLLAGDPGGWAAAVAAAPERACWKAKVGRGDPVREQGALRGLRAARPALELRLDANRAFTLAEARAWQSACPGLAPAWIEEPLADPRDLPAWRAAGGWPAALDESLGGLAPAEEERAAAWVLKPQVLGLGEVLRRFARAAPRGIPCVVSSCFEGAPGLRALAALAALAPGRPAPGLGTAEWLGRSPAAGPWRHAGGAGAGR